MYLTIKVPQEAYQLTIDDLFNGISEEKLQALAAKNTSDTRTRMYDYTPMKLREKMDVDKLIECLNSFNTKYASLINTEDKHKLYYSFSIPKRNGKLRRIDAPHEELMGALNELKTILETQFYANHHTTAFAYVKGRSVIDAVKRHQSNKSKWFLKLDFSNFFGSTTPEFVHTQFKQIFPFNLVYERPDGEEAISTALSLCFLNGGLPQGTPISPIITNIMMIPIDHKISQMVRSNTPHLCYTRYADDMLMSSSEKFNWGNVIKKLNSILEEFNVPFKLNNDKTRYGSSAGTGANWNLGVMLNANNDITIGHAKKKAFKVAIFSFMTAFKNGEYWSIGDTQELAGQISWYINVEKDNITKILADYSKKFGASVMACIKKVLKREI